MTTVNQTLLDRALKTQQRTSWREQAWSNDAMGAVKYTAYRSRGFLIRRVSHRLIDVIETVSLSLVAHPALVKAGYIFTSCSLLIAVIVGAMIIGFRSRYLYGERLNARTLMAFSYGLVLASFAWAWQHAVYNDYLLPLAFVFGSKFIVSLLSTHISWQTAEVMTKQRVYFPIWLNWGAIFATVAVVGVASLSPGIVGFYTLIVGTFFIKMFSMIWPYLIAKQVMKLNQFFDNRTPVKSAALNSFANLSDMSWRTFVEASVFVAPLILTHQYIESDTHVLVWAWAFKCLADSLIARPFRSTYVEICQALQARHWEFIRVRLYFASRQALGIFAAIAVTIVAALFSGFSGEMAAFFAWMLASCATQGMIQRHTTVGREKALAPAVVFLRMICAPVLFIALPALNVSAMVGLFVPEALALAYVLRANFRVSLVAECEYRFAELAHNKNVVVDESVYDFLNTYHLVSPILRSWRIPQGLYRVELTKRMNSHAQIQAVCHEIRSFLRKTDRILVVNKRQIVVWAPFSDNLQVIANRFITTFPLLVSNFEEISSLECLAGDAPITEFTPPTTSVLNNKIAFLAYLETTMKAKLSQPSAGKWWTITDAGWTSLSGFADALTARSLFAVHRQAESEPRMFRNKARRMEGSTRLLVPFRPYGKLLAVYECDAMSDELSAFLQNLSASFFVWTIVREPIGHRTVSAFDWFALMRILSDIKTSKRAQMDYRIERVATAGEEATIRVFDGVEFQQLVIESPLAKLPIALPRTQEPIDSAPVAA